ncbi:LysM peptidoglycan-binding domain-containing protein [Histomonas meleagridis]|uniref:LysM peptidoglycan-binding domain-containing protein n=1 Tax=Histomonas meleagridis TaxID=135588 RepID=UPI00355AC181|nr:LysM peptidoglycan-binding domain-containing protein [Histomonas meleagridis]KAH0804332.1 LysM peptidoglycan-binding domain-containing protein [Histomonas meleagridis]
MFDIPFSKCKISDFHNITINTTYEAIKQFPVEYRTLRVDGGLTLNIFNVKSGDILQKLDIIQANVHLYLPKYENIIEGPIRVNNEDGGQLFVHGSFSTNKNKLIKIIHTNDIHCSLDPSDQKGVIGFPRTISYVKSEKEKALKNGYGVLFFDAGDFISGYPLCNLKDGINGINAINKAEYDAVTIGNHFWDFGYDSARVNLNASQIPILCANVKDTDTVNPLNFKPYTTKTVFGVKVGIFGLTTPYTPEITSKESVKTVVFDSDLIGVSKSVVKTLREEEHCDVIILLSHLGYEYLELNSNYLAENFNGIDVIIDGHSHTELEHGAFHLNNDYQTLIVQTGSYLNNIGITDLQIDYVSNKVVGKKSKLISYENMLTIEPDPEITEFLRIKNEEIESIVNESIAQSDLDLLANTTELRMLGNSQLASLITTSILTIPNRAIDIALLHGGGIRSSITKGTVTFGTVLEILPFDDNIVYLNISGRQLREVIQFGTRTYKQTLLSCFPFFSGLTYTIDMSKQWNESARITEMKLVDANGTNIEDIADDKYYTLATVTILAEGGDGYTMLSNITRYDYSDPLTDIFKLFLKELKVIKGSEEFFYRNRINEINGNNENGINQTPNLKNGNNYSVIVDGIFSSLYDNNENETFYNYKVKANGYVMSDLKCLQKIGNVTLNYFATNDIIYAADKDEILFGMNVQKEPVNIMGKCNSMFKKMNNNFECVVNTPFLILSIVLLVVIVAIVVTTPIVCVMRKKARNLDKINDMTDKLVFSP